MTSRSFAQTVSLAPVLIWARWISPALPPRCKYEPSCSRYAIEAVSDMGIFRGYVLAAWRLLRCNPFSRGGFDPVASQEIFGRDGHHGSCQHETAIGK